MIAAEGDQQKIILIAEILGERACELVCSRQMHESVAKIIARTRERAVLAGYCPI